MSTRPDLDRFISEWLDAQAPDGAPERWLEASRARIRTTQQRRAPWPARRVPTMNKAISIVAAAAAVVVAAIIGVQVLGDGGVGAAPPSDGLTSFAPSPSAAASAVAGPVDFTGLEPGGTELGAGTYVITYASPVEVTFTVPDEPFRGWPSAWFKALYDWGPWHQTNAARLGAVIVENVYADPCSPELGMVDPPVGPAVDDLVDALAAMPGADNPRLVNFDGYGGWLIQLTGQERPAGCVEEPFVWQTTRGGESLMLPDHGDTTRVWVLDVEGNRLVIWATEDFGFQYSAEMQRLVDSIEIDVP
jgi:hypothetical protein